MGYHRSGEEGERVSSLSREMHIWQLWTKADCVLGWEVPSSQDPHFPETPKEDVKKWDHLPEGPAWGFLRLKVGMGF